MSANGAFVAVVGPSGVGKDSLISGAREMLAGDDRFSFVQRVITRPDGDINEDHEAMDEVAFLSNEREGAFCLSWEAHGLRYGLRRQEAEKVHAGRIVIANASRRMLQDMADIFDRLVVFEVVASPDVIVSRLASRGRESTEEIKARLSRTASVPDHLERVQIVNDGSIEDGVRSMTEALRALAVHNA